ncbi:MAG TPA: YceD family protein [Caulobacteraceae bacterium]|jgi:hypothetical protein|nr:YceD family protein [Caulobacteraceae bacterium]
MSTAPSLWPHLIGLGEARRGASLHLVADDAARARIAAALDLEALERLEADLTLSEWLDGAEITGAWRARIAQICGISLDPFETELEGRFRVRVVPPGSPNAPTEVVGDVEIDPRAEDPPDVLESETIDAGGYVIEHLALEIDPFPRKPGVAFEAPEGPSIASPFDVLRALKRD